MNPLLLRVVPGAVVKGGLYDHYAAADLDEDLVQVALPNGVVVDAGWYPAGDPAGAFKVVAYRDYWRNQLAPPVVTRDPRAAAAAVGELTYRFGEAVLAAPGGVRPEEDGATGLARAPDA